MPKTQTLKQEKKEPRRQKLPIIDCDVHNALPSHKVLYPYLSQRWQRNLEMVGSRGRIGSYIARGVPHAARRDAFPPSGTVPGSDLGFMQEQLLDYWNIEYGILNCLTFFSMNNVEYAAALMRAVNDWQIDEWLEPEPRLRASMLVPCEDGELATSEIDRLGEHPGFVQLLMLARTMEPLGRRKYWKMYEAAVRHDLPIGIHFAGVGAGPITAAGKPSHYIEDHTGMTQAFQTHLTSLVCEGVFEHFPTLKVVLIEVGFAWLPPLMWRLDRAYKKLREEVPYLKRLPSEYIREHFWLTTQPLDEPPKREYFEQMFEYFDAENKVMFATDYPHWDFDAPDRVLPTSMAVERRRKIMAENARALYKF